MKTLIVFTHSVIILGDEVREFNFCLLLHNSHCSRHTHSEKIIALRESQLSVVVVSSQACYSRPEFSRIIPYQQFSFAWLFLNVPN